MPRLRNKAGVVQAVLTTYGRLILVQHLVVLAHRYTEYNRRHILETVDPFLPFRPLAPYVK